MRVKRFKNLWAMGLILFGTMLVAFYVAKIFFPEFVVGVAETPSIVKFGEFVDSHLWAYYLFNGAISFCASYLICCASCRTYKLNLSQTLVCVFAIVALFAIERFLVDLYVVANYTIMLVTPTICVKLSGKDSGKCFYPLVITLTSHWVAQAFTLRIRDISIMISYPNSATFTILVIDAFIWLVLFYLYFNYKGEQNYG